MANKCTICGKPVVLQPSAKERAAKDAVEHSADHFTRLFTEHAECVLDKRREDTNELMRRGR